MSKTTKLVLWHEAEKQIREEILWLSKVIDTFVEKEKHAPNGCKYCYLRNIATLIVQGNIFAKEIKKDDALDSFWLPLSPAPKRGVYHGSNWHRETMERIEHHFETQGYEVIREPTLQQGRADLGVYKPGELDLFIEAGTISLYKLMMNLTTMKKFTYLIVPSNELLVEFTKP